MTLFLTSEGFYEQDVRDNFKKLITIKDNIKVGLVAITSYKKGKHIFDAKFEQMESMGSMRENIEFINLNAYAVKNLVNFDMIVLDGGNPYQLLSIYKAKGLDKIIKKMHEEGKVVVGISGSSLVMCLDLTLMNDFIPQFNKNYVEDYDGFNFVDFYIFPHYGREDELFGTKEQIEEKIVSFENRTKKKVIRLTDKDFEIIS